MTRRYRQPTDEAIVDALRAGLSNAAVVRTLGGQHARIARLRAAAGLPVYPTGKQDRPVDEGAVLAALRAGAPWVATAKRFGIGYKRVRTLALASGLPLKARGQPFRRRPLVAPDVARAHLAFTCAPPPKAVAGRARW